MTPSLDDARRNTRSVRHRLREGARERVRIDTRSLAVFRVLAGVLIVADVLARSRNLVFFYTEQGVVPSSLAVAAEPAAAYSVFTIPATSTGTAGLFVLTGLVGVVLAIGYHTRVTTIAAFVLVVSLDLRNPFVTSFADTLFATLLFFALFLPLGERWSVDAVASDRPRRASIAGVATALILVQMVTMYVVNGYHKTASELWWSGEVAVLVLGIDEMTHLFGDALRAWPELLRLGGLTWFGMLLSAWLLLVLRGRPRHLLVAAFAIAHLSMALTVRIGAFSFVCLAGLLLFVQSSAWRDATAVVDRIARTSSVGGRLVAVAGTRRTRLRESTIAIADRLPRFMVRASLRTRLPLDRRRLTVAAGVLLAVVIGLGIVTAAVDDVGGDTPRAELEAGASAFVAFQTDWSIFAPNPRTVDRYYVFPARTADGEVIDVYNDRQLSYDRPYDELQRQHGTYRERFYMGSLRDVDGAVADELATHLCETYETDDGGRLTHLNTYAVDEEITRETIDDPERRDRTEHLLTRHGCGDAEPTSIHPP